MFPGCLELSNRLRATSVGERDLSAEHGVAPVFPGGNRLRRTLGFGLQDLAGLEDLNRVHQDLPRARAVGLRVSLGLQAVSELDLVFLEEGDLREHGVLKVGSAIVLAVCVAVSSRPSVTYPRAACMARLSLDRPPRASIPPATRSISVLAFSISPFSQFSVNGRRSIQVTCTGQRSLTSGVISVFVRRRNRSARAASGLTTTAVDRAFQFQKKTVGRTSASWTSSRTAFSRSLAL